MIRTMLKNKINAKIKAKIKSKIEEIIKSEVKKLVKTKLPIVLNTCAMGDYKKLKCTKLRLAKSFKS